MSVPAPQKVYLDDGSGTYPTDISSKVRMTDEMSVSSYGRADELTQPAPTSLTLVLDNADGRFTDGTVALSPGVGIRMTETIGATTRNRFTGVVDSLPLSWPSGGQEFSLVGVTAYDPLADLSRRPIRSMLEQEILLDGPTAYYTLGEAEGSTSAGDTSGHGQPPLTMAGTGTPVVFGNGTGPVDGLTAAQFASTTTTNMQYLNVASPGGFTTGGSWSLEGFLNWDGTSGTVARISLDEGGASETSISWNAAGAVFGRGGSIVGTAPATNSTHQFALTFNGTNLIGYVDGVNVASTTTTFTATTRSLSVGVNTSGTISHVAVYDGIVLSPTRVASHAAVLTGFVETTDARLTRIASYAGLTPTTVTPSGQLMEGQQTSGQSIFDALQTVADAEGGVLFVDGSGTLTMQGRYYRGLRTTADVTLGEQEAGADTAVTWDRQQLINQVTVTRTGGATQVVQDGTPALIYPQSLDLAVDTDANALYHAQWVASTHSTTAPRLGSVTFDLLTSPVAEDIFGAEIGDRLDLSAMPSQLWSALGDYVIEGWTESRTATAWTLTVNLLPWELFRVFILNDSTFGRLDAAADNPLGY